MDFDAVHDILYTGDEMGYIQRWDLTPIFNKLNEVKKKDNKALFRRPTDILGLDEALGDHSSKITVDTATFVTGVDAGGGSFA
jgi:hypothetical protein